MTAGSSTDATSTASRNTMSRLRAVRATVQVWRLHPSTIGIGDMARWFVRKLWLNRPFAGSARPTRI